MDSLSHLAFAFARFVAREHPRFRLPRRTSGLAAIRRWNFGHRHQRNLNRNGGLRCRGCLHSCHHSVHRSNPPGAPGPSTRTDAPREEVLVMPKEAAVAPNNVDEQVVAVPNVAPGVGIEHEDEASASNITMDAAQVLPSPPVYAPMEWILVGPSAGWLVDDPDRSFTDEELATPPLPRLMYSCPAYGNGSSLPSPTPSDEDPEHFNPPGCDPLPEFTWTPAAVPLDALKPRLVINLLPKVKTEEIEAAAPMVVVPMLPDLNHPAPYVEEKEHLEVAPPSALPTPLLKDRVLLCRLASAMVVRPARIRVGTWSPVALGLTSGIADLRLHEVALPSSSAEEPLHR
ncbi:hypothetical protein ZWY2020_007549 [Hordeum vulgare]|nr:hypothetical protein ZWY2020_007549 [Hordeum vulgare]